MHANHCRRTFLKSGAAALCAGAVAVRGRFARASQRVEEKPFRLRYVLGSCMYGETPLAEILPEVSKAGAADIDIWPRVHGNQREQVEEMGLERFRSMLARHAVRLGIITRFDLGPFALQDEMEVVQSLGGRLIVTGSRSGKGAADGKTLKDQVRAFVKSMAPQVAAAERCGVTIGIENHGRALIETPDSIRYLADLAPSDRLGIALAPYHLPQEESLLARLIEDLGPRLVHFYAWQYGKGCMTKLPKADEMLQLPGRGPLDFTPLLGALKRIGYAGWMEIFMHPVPRGIPILPATRRVTEAINASRTYLEDCLKKI